MMPNAFWDVLEEKRNQNHPEYYRTLSVTGSRCKQNVHTPALLYRRSLISSHLFSVVIIAFTVSSDKTQTKIKEQVKLSDSKSKQGL